MNSILSTFMGSVMIVILFVTGAMAMFALDRRPATFPAPIHWSFWFLKLDWTAPDSLQVASIKKGAATQQKQDTASCTKNLQGLQSQLAEQSKATEQLHAQELIVEKQSLKAQQDAVLARNKESFVLRSIDKMHTTGNSCQKAEQIIRGVIK